MASPEKTTVGGATMDGMELTMVGMEEAGMTSNARAHTLTLLAGARLGEAHRHGVALHHGAAVVPSLARVKAISSSRRRSRRLRFALACRHISPHMSLPMSPPPICPHMSPRRIYPHIILRRICQQRCQQQNFQLQ